MTTRPSLRWAALAVFLAATGCAVSVAGGLDEPRANRVVALLSESGIATDKIADPAEPGRFRVEVSSDDAARAVGILVDQGPPEHDAPGVLDAIGTSSLVPSPLAEHERVLAGIAGDLAKSLEGIDGVLSARVHLAAPRADPLEISESTVAPSAAVLIRHRGAAAPIAEADVKKLVAFSVPGLTAERVAVVYARAMPPRPAPDVVRVGPVSATRAAARKVRGAMLLVLLLNIGLAATIVALWTRLRRFRSGASEPPDPRVIR